LELALTEAREQTRAATTQRNSALRDLAAVQGKLNATSAERDEALAEEQLALQEQRNTLSAELLAAAKKRKLVSLAGASQTRQHYDSDAPKRSNRITDDQADESGRPRGAALQGIRHMLDGYVTTLAAPVKDAFSLLEEEAQLAQRDAE